MQLDNVRKLVICKSATKLFQLINKDYSQIREFPVQRRAQECPNACSNLSQDGTQRGLLDGSVVRETDSMSL
jgi:hypothetical protein